VARLDAAGYVDKWSRRLKGATSDIRAGIARVSVAPGIKAAQQVALFRNKILASIDDGTWANQVRGVTLDSWQTAASGKGVDRISAGVDGAMNKQLAMAQRLLAAVDQAVADANKTPRGTLQDNINRMVTFVTSMNARKLKRPAGK
jgi:hypothetical protein